MPKADKARIIPEPSTHVAIVTPGITRQRKTLPLGDDLQPTIERLRSIASVSVDSLITEGPVHPDHVLLDLCGEALHLLKNARDLKQASHDVLGPDGERVLRTMSDFLTAVQVEKSGGRAGQALRLSRTLFEEAGTADRAATPLLRRARNLRAMTAAGVYAKALIVRASKTGAAELAMSLAEDLIACPGLRQSLWPNAIGGEG